MRLRPLLMVLLAALLLRVLAATTFPVYPLIDNTADTEIYDAGARTLAAGQGYQWHGQPTAFFPVGWPLLLSLAYRVGGMTPRSGQALNVLLAMLLLGAACGMNRRLHGARAGAIALIILALLPDQAVFPAFLMSEVAFTAFFTASLWALSAGTRRPGRLVLAGLLMGCATLIRGLALVYPLLVLVTARFGERRSFRASLGAAAIFGAALLLPLAPWTARNHRVFGSWVLVANDGGMNFLMGNHHGATGARHEPAGGLPDTGNEVRDDREGYRRGLEFIRERPLEFLSLLPRKLVRLIVPAPLLTYRAELRAKWPGAVALFLLTLDQLAHVGLWLLALAALLGARRRRGPPDPAPPGAGLWLAGGALVLWIGLHLLFLGGARYFFPMMPVLAGLAARGLAGGAPRRAPSGSGS